MNAQNPILLHAYQQARRDADYNFMRTSPLRSQLPNFAGLSDEKLRKTKATRGLPALLNEGLTAQIEDKRNAQATQSAQALDAIYSEGAQGGDSFGARNSRRAGNVYADRTAVIAHAAGTSDAGEAGVVRSAIRDSQTPLGR